MTRARVLRTSLKGGTTRNISPRTLRGMRSPTFGLWLTPVRWRFNNFRGATSRTPRPAHQHAHTNALCAHHHLRTCACKPSQKTALRVRCAGLTRTDHGDALLLLRCVRRARTLLAHTSYHCPGRNFCTLQAFRARPQLLTEYFGQNIIGSCESLHDILAHT